MYGNELHNRISLGRAYTNCVASSCVTGFSTGIANNCLAYNCTTTALAVGLAINCTADNTGPTTSAKGFSTTFTINCVASNQSGTTGIGYSTSFADNCAGYNNITNVVTTAYVNANFINLSAAGQPYQTAGSQFAPNVSQNGLALRGTSIPIPGQTDNQDIGAVQSINQTAVLSVNRIAIVQGDYDEGVQ